LIDSTDKYFKPSLPLYPADDTDAEWVPGASNLTVMTDNASHRHHELRDILNASCRLIRLRAR
jgi:hypothetical protein